MSGVSWCECHFPRSSRMTPRVPSNPSTAVAPKRDQDLWLNDVDLLREIGQAGLHFVGVGGRLPELFGGMSGRHFRTFAM